MDYEYLFFKALATLMEINGGSLETAMDDMKITITEKENIRNELAMEIGY